MQLSVFNFESTEEQRLSEIRSLEINGEIWFVSSDIAKALGYKNPSDAVNRHCKSRGVAFHDTPTSSGIQSIKYINEPNVYRLIIKSNLPSAEKFESWLFEDVLPSIRSKGFYGKIDRVQLPNFIERYKDNFHKIPKDHFSVISEMFARMYIELEKVGYNIPDKAISGKKMMPDISVGQGFAKFLKKEGSLYLSTRKKYTHRFPNGREVEANMYHIDALPDFIRYINLKWIPENAEKYFKTRDPQALEYLPKLLR